MTASAAGVVVVSGGASFRDVSVGVR